jgi:hypothetical protein
MKLGRWYEFGVFLLIVAGFAGTVGLDDVAAFLAITAVACAMLDVATG